MLSLLGLPFPQDILKHFIDLHGLDQGKVGPTEYAVVSSEVCNRLQKHFHQAQEKMTLSTLIHTLPKRWELHPGVWLRYQVMEAGSYERVKLAVKKGIYDDGDAVPLQAGSPPATGAVTQSTSFGTVCSQDRSDGEGSGVRKKLLFDTPSSAIEKTPSAARRIFKSYLEHACKELEELEKGPKQTSSAASSIFKSYLERAYKELEELEKGAQQNGSDANDQDPEKSAEKKNN